MTESTDADERIVVWLQERREGGDHQFFKPGIIASVLNLPKGNCYNETPRVRCMRLQESGVLEAKYVGYDVWAYRYRQTYEEGNRR